MVKIYKSDLGNTLIRDFLNYFSFSSIKNTNYGQIMLHVILGQALCKNVYYVSGSRKIDIRIHLLLIKPQATGKGAGYGVCEDLSNYLDINFQTLTETTDAGMVGTKVYDSSLKQEVVIDGLLKTADIIGMEEASVIFDLTSDFSKKNMTLMQICMNPLWDASCHISKRLGTQLIEFDPHASFLLTSYPPDKLQEKITKTGFLDRMIPVFETTSLEERLEVIKLITQNLNTSKSQVESMRKDVFRRFKKVVNCYKKGEYEIKIPKDMREALLESIEEFAMKVLDASPKAREKLEHFVSRLYEILIKLSIHHALLELRTTIDISDVMYARMVYMPIWKNLIISIESLLIIDPSERARRNKIIWQSQQVFDDIAKTNAKKHVRKIKVKRGKKTVEETYVRRLTMLPRLQEQWDYCSKETADNNLKKLEKNADLDISVFKKISKLEEKDKYFERKKIGSVIYIKKIKNVTRGK